jgi:hypothetical protein
MEIKSTAEARNSMLDFCASSVIFSTNSPVRGWGDAAKLTVARTGCAAQNWKDSSRWHAEAVYLRFASEHHVVRARAVRWSRCSTSLGTACSAC